MLKVDTQQYPLAQHLKKKKKAEIIFYSNKKDILLHR